MGENTLNLIAFLKLILVCVFAFLYSSGGISGKWKRRYVGPLWMGCGLLMFAKLQGTFNYWQLLYPALLCASLHLGYGGTDDVWIKIRKRSIYGLCLGVSALPLVLNSGLWVLFGFHVSLCVASSVLLGVFNPVKAREEESLIAILSTVLVLFLI